MNRKKKILNSLAIIVYVVVITLPFLECNRKNKLERRFTEIESAIYLNIPAKQIEKSELISTYCDTLSRFISENPIELKVDLNCSDHSLLDSSGTEFILKVQKIGNEYRNQRKTATRRMFIVFIISQVLLVITRTLIAKRFKPELINYSEPQKKDK